MDSRSHDDFIQPERSIVDDCSPAPEAASTSEQAMSHALTDPSASDELDGVIDDLELELASLLTPELEAMDLEGTIADAPVLAPSETLDVQAVDQPAAMIATADLDTPAQPAGPATVVAEAAPAPTNAPTGSTASDAQAVETGTLAGADDLELALDAMAADMLAAETVVVSPVPMNAEPVAIEAVADARAPQPALPETPPMVEAAVVESSGQTLGATATVPVAPRPGDIAGPDASDGALVEASAALPPESFAAVDAATAEAVMAEPAAPEIVPAQAIVIPEPAAEAGNASPAPDMSEAVSFEQALDAQDILSAGFEAAVRAAAGRSNARFLFQMPLHTVADCQRVAAVNLPGDEAPKTVLILLRADGRSYRMEDARASDNPFAGMAVSYGGLLAHLKSLPVRAAA